MKKLTFILVIILLLALIFLNFKEIKILFMGKEAKTTINDYFPIQENIKYIYKLVNQDLYYEVSSDYTDEDIIQLRIKENDGIKVSVISVRAGKATNLITTDEEFFRENILNLFGSNEENFGEILLMEPLETGTEWNLSDNSLRKITDTDTEVETSIGVYKAIEVTTESDNETRVDYYAKGVGLVKSVITRDEVTRTIIIDEIHHNSPLIERVTFYYPDLNDMKIARKTENVKFRTNDKTETVFTDAYKQTLSKEYRVLTKEVKIQNINLHPDGILYIDLNKALSDDTEMTALYEGMAMQSIVNTFARFYQTDLIRFAINNEDYISDNIQLLNKPFEANYIDFPLFYDIVIYGGTPSGIAAAISASRIGMDVALIEQETHIGGMVTGGLSNTDVGNSSVLGGIAIDFFKTVGKHYGKEIIWDFEPHVAETTFLELLQKEDIDLYYEKRLDEDNRIIKDDNKIISIQMESGEVFRGQIFIDSSYEGDLMAMADVSYTVGRESKNEYYESFAGHVPPIARNGFYYPMKAYDENGTLYYGISNVSPVIYGQGDNKVQAYNYRLCVTDQIGNQIPFYKPNNYNADEYKLLAAWLNEIKEKENRDLKFSDVVYLGKLPNNKYDVNHNGPFSTDLIGGSWEYPEADYKRREEIKDKHKEYIQGLLYFISNDLSVSAELRADVNRWGYAGDEFEDNDYWPYQLYIREGRRMIGDFVLTESDIRKKNTKQDSIGMGSYSIDSHNIQRYVNQQGYVVNEGEIQLLVSPYEIPYRVLLPKESEAENLLVTVCISASHVAYSSVRMEPQYMIMGEAAGIAASIAIEDNTNVQNIDYDKLEQVLKVYGAVLE
ncbi:FAD-dependent oxidoreductase [Tissierella creatinini]|nr:FAD-dependent oxidoreductase [Tissierella creatinini]TJX62362.1 FAD-dependent oxidoreductase [Soehngenia saccharolytica]